MVPSDLAGKALGVVWRSVRHVLLIFDAHYTPLAVLAIGSVGCALIFLGEYLRHDGFWRRGSWRIRGMLGCVRLWIVLILIKGVLGSLT